MRDYTGDFIVNFRGGTRIDAVRDWLIGGALPETAPNGEVLAAADRGPMSVRLTPAENRAVMEAVFPFPLDPPDEAPTPATIASLQERDILVRAARGLALSPTHLWTLGIAFWSERRLALNWQPPSVSAEREYETFALIGDRVVRRQFQAVSDDTIVVVYSRVDRSAVDSSLGALIAPDGPRAFSIHAEWGSYADVTEDFSTETEWIDAEVDGGGVRWSVGSGNQRTAETLSRQEAGRRIAAMVGRGSGNDRRRVDHARKLARIAGGQRWNPVTRGKLGNAVAAIGLEELWTGAGNKRMVTHVERARQSRAAEYWRQAPAFTSKRG